MTFKTPSKGIKATRRRRMGQAEPDLGFTSPRALRPLPQPAQGWGLAVPGGVEGLGALGAPFGDER